MKLTKSQLKQIIKEELEAVLDEAPYHSGLGSYAPRGPVFKRDTEAERTAKGNITQDTREDHATVGKDKFPIFDKKSAKAAIDLRGHTSKANRKKIINKAAKYAPAAAKKAREADKK
jgi:hypothetical protein